MVVVSDTSPISNLMTIGELPVLKSVFDKVVIPEGVKTELEAMASHKSDLADNPWIMVQRIKDRGLLNELLDVLDQGEAEAIVLAIEKRADYLIIDERKGRRIAVEYGLKITGLLGLLTVAKKRGQIKSISPYIEKLVLVSGFRVNKKLRDQILRDNDEL